MADDRYDRYFASEETYRVKLPGDAWIDVKKEMSIADWDKFEADAIRISRLPGDGDGNDGLGKVDAAFHRSNVTLLEVNIIAWSFEIPITRTNIGKLRRSIVDTVVLEIDKLNISPKERKAALAATKK